MAQKCAVFMPDGGGIAAVRTGLFAADEHLGGPVNARGCRGCRRRWHGCDRGQRACFGGRFGIGAQTFPSTLTPEAAFAHAAKACGRVKKVGGIHPNHTRGQFRRQVQRKIYVFSPNTCSQSVACVVGQFGGLGGCAEG